MSHIDDAHHTEGDRKTDRREQQHAPQAQTVNDILRSTPGGKPFLSISASPPPHRPPSPDHAVTGIRNGGQQCQSVLVAAINKNIDRLYLLFRRGIAGENNRCQRASDRARLMSSSVSAANAASSACRAETSLALKTACAARSRVVRSELRKVNVAESRTDRAPQLVD